VWVHGEAIGVLVVRRHRREVHMFCVRSVCVLCAFCVCAVCSLWVHCVIVCVCIVSLCHCVCAHVLFIVCVQYLVGVQYSTVLYYI